MTNQRISVEVEQQQAGGLAGEGGKTKLAAGDGRKANEMTVTYNGLKELLPLQNGTPAGPIPAKFVLPLHLQPGLSAKGDHKTGEVPLIDIAGVNDNPERRKQAAAAIADACMEWGFFQVVGHGVSVPLKERMLGLGREFFELPVAEKVKYQTGASDITIPVLGGSRINSSGHHSWRDLFRHKSIPVSDAELEKWPTKPESYRETVMDYSEETKNLRSTIFELMSEGLNLQTQYFCEALGGDELEQIMMMAYYPRCPQPDLALGLIGHTDPNVMTMQIQDDVGLEMKKDGLWIPVVPVPGGISVIIGDSLKIMTNNKFESVEHRVVACDKRDRVSVMMFVQPKDHIQLSVVPELVPSSTTAMYQDMTWGFYVNYAKQGLDNRLTDIALK